MKTTLLLTLKMLSLFGFVLLSQTLVAQEICDNGVDDDGDGLIDLNDGDDCFCGFGAYETLEGDFEDYSCCPNNVTSFLTDGVECLSDGWGSGSFASPDFFNTCDFMGGLIVPAIPEPIPSGNGAIGLFMQDNYQESIGVCLDDPLLAGQTYEISFYLGFNEDLGFSSPLNVNMVVYGAQSCADFPSNVVTCLDDDPGWEELGVISVSGSTNNSWTLVEESLTINTDIEAIAIGPECYATYQYHFIDNIVILGSEPGDPITQSGDCIDGVVLETPFVPGSTYQWYLDGVAISGANSNIYNIPTSEDEGDYIVLVDDGIECTISPTLEVFIDADVIDISGSVVDVICEDIEDGAIDIDIDSPNMPYDINWNNGETTEDITGLAAGDYSVTVIDDKGCQGEESFTITEPPLTFATVMGDCNSGVTVGVVSTDGSDSFQWYYNDMPVSNATTNPYLVPTDQQGEYYVQVSNGANCTFSVPVDVFFNTQVIQVTGQVQNVLCHGDDTGGVNIEIANNDGPFTYQWNNGNLLQDLSNVTEGFYQVTVTDDYGCSGTAEFVIQEPTDMTAVAIVTQPMGNEGGMASISVVGGIQPYTYLWSNGNDTNFGEDLPPGTYTVIVEDANGCQEIVTFSIEGNFTVIETVSDTGCFGSCDGAITLEIDGPPVEYDITWSDPLLSGLELSSLCAGDYAYTVTDEEEAAFSGSITINENEALDIQLLYEDTLCSNLDTINIISNISGGVGPYTYLWSDGSTNDTLFSATIGMYGLTVTDSLSCQDSIDISIVMTPAPIITTSVISANCDGGATGAIDVTVTDGVPPFSYLWDNGETTSSLVNLAQGTYTVVITDSLNCTYQETIEVPANTGISVTPEVNNSNCEGDDDGNISLEITGGETPYTIIWSNSATTDEIIDLAPADYSVTITDATGCSLNEVYTIVQNSEVTLTAVVENNNCFNATEGSIVHDINSDSSYSVLWSNQFIEEDLFDLAAGDYSITLTDGFLCEYIYDYTITEGKEITYEPEIIETGCNGAADGSISLTNVEGTSPISFLWDNGSITSSITDLVSGSYAVTITDGVGCEVVDQFIIPSNTDITVEAAIVNNECAEDINGSITVAIAGGSPPYTVTWEDGSNDISYTDLSAGDYTLTVIDAEGCDFTETYTVTAPSLLAIEENINIGLCEQHVHTISITASGGTEPYQYEWSTGEVSDNIVIDNSGAYSVTVTDNNDCTITESYDVTLPTAVELSTVSIITPTSSNNDGSILIDISGGTEPYNIEWSNGQQGELSLDGLGVGQYGVTVTDDNGCTQSDTYNLSPEDLMASYVVATNPCFGDCVGNIAALVTGGVEPYTFSWSDGGNESISSMLCNGEYQVTITDALGSIIESEIIPITSPSVINVSGNIYDLSCIESDDGAIAINAQGGTSPFDYLWDNGEVIDSIVNLPSGSYQLTVTDEMGCTESTIYTLDDIPTIDISAEAIPLDCDETTGSILLLGENQFDYPIFINDQLAEISNENIIDNLLPDAYTISYQINETCIIESASVAIDALPDSGASLSLTQLTLDEGETGEISVIIDSDTEEDFQIFWEAINEYNCVATNINDQCTTISLTGNQDETVECIVIDDLGCETILSLSVEIDFTPPEIFIANIFSPNGDGVNDEFLIQSTDDSTFVNELLIYDRWGNQVFAEGGKAITDLTSWDGTYKGQSLNPAVYIYIMNAVLDGEEVSLTGDITLVK